MLLILLVFLKLYALYSDLGVELYSEKQYIRNIDGIIVGAEPIVYESGDNKEIFLLVHGWLSTPSFYNNFIPLIDKEKYDYHSVLLPYHARTITDLAEIDYGVIIICFVV